VSQTPQLNRSLSLGLLTLYGLGTTIGAGIFVLIGKVAGAGGAFAPVSFLLAAAIAGLSALSFAEMASRFPESAGEAVYVKEGPDSSFLALIVGLTVAGAGIVSTATIIVGFSGYLSDIATVSLDGAQVGMTLVLAAVAIWGIRVSVSVAAIVTLVEIGVLVAILGFGVSAEIGSDIPNASLTPDGPAPLVWPGVIYGAILAFYAFIGFEDIVNVAEETRDARRIVPRAILITLAVTTVLYGSIALLAATAVPPDELAASDAPLTLLFERVSGLDGDAVSVIAMVSVLNGALIQIIMASRVLFGLTRRGWLPGPLGYVHPSTRTPVVATAFCAVVIIGLAFTVNLEKLAVAASVLTLFVFMAVNAALLRFRFKHSATYHGGFRIPVVLPLLAIASIAFLLLVQLGNIMPQA
jgi:basic amino acid/polyamine antiporter, APA family